MAATRELKGCPLLDLGVHTCHLGISPEAQRCFDSGLVQFWGFNHEDAAAHFEDCLSLSPSCIPALILQAFCFAPNYNNPTGLDIDYGAALLKDAHHIKHNKPLWKALLDAACLRFKPLAELEERNALYCEAMAKVADAYPHDAEVATLYVESIMNKRPWALWPSKEEFSKCREARLAPPSVHPETLLIGELLDEGVKRWPKHPGLLHLTIHYWELSPTPGILQYRGTIILILIRVIACASSDR